uniref:Uncharacterized protein n=1 Tax=Anguilla anguilla TaxID=7936 RepID=A0A0E9VX48_ANGAN
MNSLCIVVGDEFQSCVTMKTALLSKWWQNLSLAWRLKVTGTPLICWLLLSIFVWPRPHSTLLL